MLSWRTFQAVQLNRPLRQFGAITSPRSVVRVDDANGMAERVADSRKLDVRESVRDWVHHLEPPAREALGRVVTEVVEARRAGSARRCPAPIGNSAPSDVDDLDSTPGGSGELLDVAAVRRDDCRAAANG